MSVTLPLIWSEERKPCNECRYNHMVAESPLGLFRLEWKGWKGQQDPFTGTFICNDGPTIHLEINLLGKDTGGEVFITASFSIEDAKKEAQDYFDKVIMACLQPEYRDTIHVMHESKKG